MTTSETIHSDDSAPEVLLRWQVIDEAVEAVGRDGTFDREAALLSFALQGAGAVVLADLNRRLREADACSPRALAALLLMHTRGEIEQGDLVRDLGYSKAAASTLVEAFVRDGLVARRTSPRDRRVVLLDLTALGRKTFLRDFAVLNERELAWAAELTPAERATLMQLLKKLVSGGIG